MRPCASVVALLVLTACDRGAPPPPTRDPDVVTPTPSPDHAVNPPAPEPAPPTPPAPEPAPPPAASVVLPPPRPCPRDAVIERRVRALWKIDRGSTVRVTCAPGRFPVEGWAVHVAVNVGRDGDWMRSVVLAAGGRAIADGARLPVDLAWTDLTETFELQDFDGDGVDELIGSFAVTRDSVLALKFVVFRVEAGALVQRLVVPRAFWTARRASVRARRQGPKISTSVRAASPQAPSATSVRPRMAPGYHARGTGS